MKAKDLIEKLQELDPDTEVMVSEFFEGEPVREIKIEGPYDGFATLMADWPHGG